MIYNYRQKWQQQVSARFIQGNVVLLVFNTSTPTREEQEHQCLCAISFFFLFVGSFKLLIKAERCDVCVWSVCIFAYRDPNVKFKRYFLDLAGGKVYDDLVAVRGTTAESSEKPRGCLVFA